MLDHFLAFGGNEVLNSARAYGYATTADCPVDWLEDPECDTIADAEGHEDYDYGSIQDAPWFDPDDPDTTGRFLGLYGIDVLGLTDSTRTATVNERTTDGAVTTGYRHTSREVRVRGWLTAIGGDALEAGMTWLRNVLEPNACGMHGGACGEADTEFFVDCPPERAEVVAYTDWVAQAVNLATNPSFEAASGTVEVRRNLAPDPRGTNIAYWGSIGATSQTRTVDNVIYHEGTSAIRSTVATAGSGAIGLAARLPSMTIASGEALIWSLWVYASKAMTLYPIAERGTPYANQVGTAVSVPAATWVKITGQITAAGIAGTSLYNFGVYAPSGAWDVGDFLVADEILVEKSPILQPYFDGANRPRLRENLVSNPSFTAGVLGWNTNSGEFVITSDSEGRTSPGSAKVTTINPSFTADINNFSSRPGALPDLAYTASAWVKGTGIANIGIEFRNSAGATIGTTTYATNTPLSDEWVRISVTAMSPAGTASVFTRVRGTLTTGQMYWVDDVLIEQSATLGDYFDGSSTPDPGFGYAWSGTANASVSYLYDDDLTPAWTGTANASASVLTGVRTDSTIGTPSIRSTHWAKSGTYSVRRIPTTTSVDSFTSVDGDAGGMQMGMEAGKTYTAIVTLRLAAPQTGSLGSSSRSIRAFYRIGAGAYATFDSSPAPNIAGEHQIRHTFTLPAGTTEAFIRLQNGASVGGGDAWWDDFLLVEGEYTGPYFDGDSPDDELTEYSWAGPANAAPSVKATRTSYLVPEGDATYLPRVDGYRRYLHSVRCISGPLVIQNRKSTSGKHVGRLVEFTLLAEVPSVYGKPKEIEIPPLVPVVVQDVPYNLAPYPSAELDSSSAGLSTNPGLRLNSTGWAGSIATLTGTVPTPYFTTGRVAYGSGFAYRGRVLGVKSGSDLSGTARISLSHVIDVTDVATGRIVGMKSFGRFAAASGEAADPHQMHATGQWLNASNGAVGAPIEMGTTTTSAAMMAGMNFTATAAKPATATKLELWIDYDFLWNTGPTGVPSDIQVVMTDADAGSDVVVATNYSTNPSVETNATGWERGMTGSNLAVDAGGRVTGELAAVGVASYRVVATASGSGSSGAFYAQQEVALGGGAGARYSFNMWSAAVIMAGSPVLGDLELRAYWRSSAGGTVLREDLLGTAPPAGGPISAQSVQPPVGATHVLVRAICRLASYASGNIVRLYTDALTVSVP